MYTGNYKTQLKEIKAYLNKWKDLLCSWIGTFDVVELATFPKWIQAFSVIPIDILTAVFQKLRD